MLTLLVFIFLLLTLFFNLMGYKKISLLTGAITLISFIVIGCGWLPAYLLHNLQMPYNQSIVNGWQKNNTIVVLGAGTTKIPESYQVKPSFMSFSRLTMAAQLYRDCRKTLQTCHILISGGDPPNNGKTEASTYRTTLLSLGVNPTDIQLETQSKNTYQNAEFTSTLLKQAPVNQIILVTSGFSLKRALLYFSYFDIHPIPISSDFLNSSRSSFPLGTNFAISDLAIHEYLGIARFYTYNFFGWNGKRNLTLAHTPSI